MIADKDKKLSQLAEAAKASMQNKKGLQESLSVKDKKISSLQEQLDAISKKAESEKQSLLENIEEIKKDSEIKTRQYTTRLK